MRPGGQGRDLDGIQRAARESWRGCFPCDPMRGAFIEALWDRGEIHPKLLTAYPSAQATVATMPMFLWKAQHVRNHRGLDR